MDKDVFPRIEIFNPLKAITSFVGRIAALGATTELCLSEHKTGAAEMLDQHLEAQPELPFGETYTLPVIERPDAGQLRCTGGWDDMGNYYSPYIDRSRS